MSEFPKQALNFSNWYAAASVGGLVLLFLFMQGSFADKVQPGTTVYARNPQAATQATALVQQVETARVLSGPGTVTARTDTRLAPRVTGRIVDMTVRVGDTVRRGQVLVWIESSELKARVAGAQAALAAAEAQSRRAEADDQRVRNLYAGEAATRQELDASTAWAGSAKAQVNEAREAVRAAESILAETRITAPYDGVVIRRDREPGDMVMPGQAVLSLQQSGGLELETHIPVQCAGFLHTGDSVTVKPAHSEISLIARLAEIQPAADPLTHTVRIKALLPDTPGLRPGTPASLEHHCGTESRLRIPQAAITQSGQITSVYRVATDGQARLRHVRTGQRLDGDIEILSGLEAGDRVVLNGVHP